MTTTCNTDAINLVKGLGPDNVVDYTSEDAHKQLEQYGKYVPCLHNILYGEILNNCLVTNLICSEL